MGRLRSYINIYHLFAEHIISYRFLSSMLRTGVFVFGGEMWHFQIRRWWNLAEEPKLIFTTQDRSSSPLKYVLDILQTEEAFTVEEYRDTHTHTHAHTHTHTYTHTHTHTLASEKLSKSHSITPLKSQYQRLISISCFCFTSFETKGHHPFKHSLLNISFKPNFSLHTSLK